MGEEPIRDKAKSMCHVLSKYYWLHQIERDLKKILIKLGIFVGKSKMKFEIKRRWESDCYVACIVPAENNIFGKDLNIMIKPDHGERRVLRETIQENSNLDTKAEDKDNPRADMIEVFVEEIEALEKDIEEALKKFKQRELAA